VSFDVVAAALYKALAEVVYVHKKWLVSIGAAMCASFVACMLSQPGDMILTETYKGPIPQPFGKVLGTIYGAGGLSEFFRGTKARIVHVGMIITSQLVIYDIVKQMLGLPATGSH
jgi:solute carrier family 25 phosphate transporter 3